ncbi:MAG: hypothetical protein O2780_14835 [Proteobacteria bacterium]|jgi:hypothetical protein|nr:hypothetical protein [Pseudomonadota bacterium]MDA1302052.1 hypothetical protein [Pseudomonadota bacterium]
MAKSITLKTLKDARKRTNEDPLLRKLGSCDARFGIKSGRQYFAISFSGFECSGIDQIDEDGLAEMDFYVDMTKSDWSRFLASQETARPEQLHALDTSNGVVKSHNARNRLRFSQYHQSFQLFFSHTAA